MYFAINVFYMHINVHMHIYMHIYMCIYMYIYIRKLYIYVCVYICKYVSQALLLENCVPLKTDNICWQIFEHICLPNKGYCSFIIVFPLIMESENPPCFLTFTLQMFVWEYLCMLLYWFLILSDIDMASVRKFKVEWQTAGFVKWVP